ncbi:zonadhesin, like [Lepisosteus oculatus]|uniref:zonadhesin, like n=1 Tax=Lepisosteus oculatus TaxID=7918 RepID=UPI00371EA3CF
MRCCYPGFLLFFAWIGRIHTLGHGSHRYQLSVSDYGGGTVLHTPRDNTVLTSCDFNNNSSPFCDFRQDVQDHSDWIRHRGATPTEGTGPSGDFPDGNGYYIYHEADNVVSGQGARLLSPVLRPRDSQLCVQFWFYMYGLESDNRLALLVQKPGAVEQLLWERQGIQSHSWLGEAVTVPASPGQDLTVVFEAVRGFSASCDTALDNITISSGACPGCLSGCDFDTVTDQCGWTTQSEPSITGWEQWNGQTDTEGTGPEDDFSKPGFGSYMLLDSIFCVPGAKSELWSPAVSNGGCLQLSFYYYMYGTATTMRLSAYAAAAGGSLGPPLFKLQGNQGQGWKKAEVRYTGNVQDVQFVIEGVYGETDKTDIAVDSVCITACQVSPTTTAKPTTSSTTKPTTSSTISTTKPTTSSTTSTNKPTTSSTTKPTTSSTTSTTKPTTSSTTSTTKPTTSSTTKPTTSSTISTTKPTTSSTTSTTKPTTSSTTKPTTSSTISTTKPTTSSTTTSTTKPITSSTMSTTKPTTSSTISTTKPTTSSTTSTTKPTTSSTISTTKPTTSSTISTTKPTTSSTTTSTTKPITSSTMSTTKPTTSSTTMSPTKPITSSTTTSTTKPTTTTTSKPPVECPPNSHYIVCGPACMPTCQAPSYNCTGSCITGCFCDLGYVYRGRRCLPLHQCGCLDEERNYYEPGQLVFGNGCSKMCRCLGNYTLECVSNECLPTEECREVSGVPGCYPKDSSTCIVAGDPHYSTFDRRHYSFMGNCTYLLSKTCNSSQVPTFAVFTDNEHRFGLLHVTYIKAVHVHVGGFPISLIKGGTVMVNGSKVNIPISPAPGVSVFKVGTHITVSADFGVTVRYDGNHYMDIKVTSDYQGKLCGLCGDYNGNAMDDFRTPAGELVSTPNDFGNSWNTDAKCYQTSNETIPQCTDEEQDVYESPAYCGMLLNPKGPFAVCHPRVNPNSFFRDCVFDVCELDGAQTSLCEALESYVNECQDRNISVGPWRNSTFCPLLCPSNNHYEPCVPPCPLSCVMSSHGQCQGPCAEGCVCDSGFIQSAGICVRQESCGCQYNGKYYQSGEEFFTPGCQSKCRCELGFPVCIPWNCSDQEYCGVQDGVLSCHPKGSAHCYVSGDPHYMTFDGRIYSFMGTCTYTLARTCRNNNGPWFSVEGKNEERGMPGVSYLRKIYVTVNGVTVTLMKSRRTLVNGLRVALPHSPSPWMSLFLSGQYVTVSTPFGLTVRWDGNHYAHITVPSSYYDQMCGLCGNYDNDAGNDFMLPDGSQAINSDDFGNSWQTDKDEDKTCRPGNDTDHPCDEHLGAEVAKPEKCGKLTNKQGPFRDCIAVVDPNPYFWSCVYDMCRYEGLLQTLCDQLQAYTDACLAAGATVHQWRAPDFCPLLCPPNSHYTLCGSQCPETCVPGHLPVGGCSSRCVEGCQCDPGFVLSDESCVPLRDCGCVDPQGSYHPVDESWYLPGCTQRCVCQGEGVIHCDNSSCSQMEICQLQNGQYGCQGLDRATCSATGDPHYTTYDGKVHHFQGSCSYTLSQPCNASSHLPYFSVVTENEHRGNNKHVSYVKAVRVRVHQHTIAMSKGRRVQVDGVQMTPPVFLDQGVTVRLSGVFVTVETDFGLRVRFDGNHHADVSVLSTYSEQLCGLCGNYNGRPGDDNLRPDGRPADSSSELGESWQVPDNRTECSHDGGVDVCDKNIEAEAKKPTSCGMIIDPQGVFQPCHSVVPPEVFLESCVYDQCGTGGDTVALCLALQSYAALCAQAGVPIDWRNKTFCPLTCPVGSHYSPCGNACPASCTEPGAPNSCDLPCVEGCVCDPGMVLSGDKCVPFNQCGCVDKDGSYRPVGDSWFPVSDCSERCVCSSSNNITCEPWRCSPAEACSVQEGTLGCHTTGMGVCHIAGDPHYYTFDGVMHTFMGTCTYTLVDVCNTSLVTPFTIVAKNEERGQPEASYLRSVTIQLQGATVTLSKNRRVLLDGRRVLTPLTISGTGASLSTSGVYSVLDTDFGLTVRFDGVHHLEITLPGAYYNKVCGMCGNFNNNGSDDSLMPDGLPAKDVVQLGNSWKAEGDSDEGCQPDDREDLDPKCTQEEESHYTALCMELLFDKRFQECHALLLQEPFLQNCVYDMCEYEGMLGTLCDNVGAYAQACQSLGITVSWRNSTFCPLPCPPNSQYSPCTAPCPPTCANLYADASCPRPPSACVEGCQCNPGFVLSGDQCVALSSCGCVDSKGEYHDVGDSWLNDHCERRCSCTPGGVLNCVAFQCSEKSVCALDSEGIRYCKPAKFDKCSISGDPHYRTFDRFVHHYQGPNTYILTQTHELPTSLAPFTVRGKNTRRGINRRVSFPKEVYIDIYGINIRFLQQRKVLVDGERVRPPFQPLQGLRLSQRSRFVQLHTDFGLSVSFDGKYHAEVVLPSTYQSHVRGLCGNYDGRSNNEYMKPDGSLTRNINEFGNSWQVSDRELPGQKTPPSHPAAWRLHRRALEENLETGFETGDCSVDQLTVVNGSSQCGALADPQGPFAPCHPRLDPVQFQESCVFDLCAEQNDATLLCASYTVYAQACQELGVTLGPWRQKLNCALSCPPNSVYNSCISACPASCADLAAPSECDTSVCVEGCHCNPGFVLSGLDCVPYSQCGCTFQGHYYLLNEKFVSEDCSQSCQCTVTGAACEPKTCPVGHICTVYNDTRNCYKESPCLSMPCWNDGICQELPEGIGFNCQCLEGFEGPLCEGEKLPPSSNQLDEKTIILIGVLVPLVVILLAVLFVCVHQHRVSKKRWKYDTSKEDLAYLENKNYKPEKTKVTKF